MREQVTEGRERYSVLVRYPRELRDSPEAMGRELLESRLSLPAGYRLEWSGQFESMQRAAARLRYVVPITLLIIYRLCRMERSSA